MIGFQIEANGPDGSHVPAAPHTEITNGFLCKSAQPIRSDVLLDLSVPRFSIKLGKPGAEILH